MADQVVAVSRFVAETARKTLADVPVQVIYNGVDTEKFRHGPSRRTQSKPFRLLYVGSWKRLKGVDLLAPIMRELGGGFELHYTAGLAAKRDEQLMPPNMQDVGRLVGDGAVIDAMNEADALLFASRSEGLPLVVIEAMACGLPVIATRGSSLIEVVDDGITGILCPQDNIEAFVGAAQKLAANGVLASDMSKAARQRALQHFSTRDMIDKWLEVYREATR
jgi:glycosyltransferase involved in cell wall biosynthesis